MTANPFLGVLLHSIGGLAAASFYLPYKGVRRWSWESYWLVGGFFSWIIAPWVLALILVPDLMGVLRDMPGKSVMWTYLFGVMWGVGGLTFGLSMRYLGMSLGYAIALGMCAVFGTLVPPIYSGKIVVVVQSLAGWVALLGIGVCVAGIAISGMAGVAKERELSEEQKKSTIKEFDFVKGMLVAVFAGVMSACMSFGFAAGEPIAGVAVKHGTADLWKNLPIWIVVLAGGFTTNFVWCVALNIKNGSGADYVRSRAPVESDEAIAVGSSSEAATATLTYQATQPVPLVLNYVLCAVAGTTWYFQFFFYGMGATKLGEELKFVSWSLHMASIIIFSTLWGISLREWRGVGPGTMRLVWGGIVVLVVSMLIIGVAASKAGLQ